MRVVCVGVCGCVCQRWLVRLLFSSLSVFGEGLFVLPRLGGSGHLWVTDV